MRQISKAQIRESPRRIAFQTVVIGGGLSGLTVAHAAARINSAHRTLVLEAGPLGPKCHLDALSGPNSGFARWSGRASDPFAFDQVSQASIWQGVGRRVVGGRGLYWGGVLCRIDESEFAGDASALQWLSSQRLDASGLAYKNVEEKLGELCAFQKGGHVLPGAMGRLMFKTVDCAVSPVYQAPFSPVEYFQFCAENQSDVVEIVPNAHVEFLSMRNSRWEIIFSAGGRECSVSAQSVVLSSGLLENAHLLEKSFKTHSKYSFTEHLVAGVACFVPKQSKVYDLLLQAASRTYIWTMSANCGFNLFLSVTQRRDGVVADVWGVGEKDIHSPMNAEFLDKGGVLVKGEKSLHDTTKDVEILKSAQDAIDNLLTLAGGHECSTTPEFPLETKMAMGKMHFDDLDPWYAVKYVSELGSVDHEACLTNPGLVFDHSGRVSNADNLYLTGPSVLKRMGSANPNLTALAMAFNIGEKLAKGDLSP